eukprot:CAMPEP_0178768496 /NCGR_PEP_ID=MMETSP0744-20121128/20276_1 /TAXON_ID=913974 /ORGANISM="Nitzschia punctata, Strain CCMP561" /LENGTH=595 /DNA_ID=CAMNT_0020424583 /DNA_START=282 /DNA_END=2068 /DNA_ORIENTATION=+
MSSKPSHVTESVADRKAARELAEARASGTVAPQVDVTTNKIINPHNPEFITKRPWYLGNKDEGPSLDHQTLDPNASDRQTLTMASADELVRKERNGTVEQKVKFKPKSKAMFKPRIRMTKSGTRSMQIDADKYGKETYDSKRDEYHGYDADSHTKKVEKIFKEREEIRRKLREENKQKLKAQEAGQDGEKGKNDKQVVLSDSDLDSDVEGSDDDSDDEFAQKEEKVFTSRLARQGGVGGAQMKVTARNLRIREDTAKYLRNLDPNSAYYDPKSRSMRDNPNPELPPEESMFAGDNFTRGVSGDAVELASTQLFAWDAAEKGVSELHPQANPSQVELLKKKFKSKSAEIQLQKKKKVLDKYGGGEYLDGSGGLANALEEKKNPEVQASTAEERKIRFGVSTTAEEYGRDGRMVKGPAKAKMVAQNIFINGHKTVWGSYFHLGAFAWGYADDHSLIRNTYCTGEAGRIANDEANEMHYGTGLAGSAALAQARGMLKALPNKKRGSEGSKSMEPPSGRSKLYGEADQKASIDKDKVKAAMDKLDREEKEQIRDKKRKYNSMNAEVDVTEEEMEAYRLRKERSADPMANIGSDEVLDYK